MVLVAHHVIAKQSQTIHAMQCDEIYNLAFFRFIFIVCEGVLTLEASSKQPIPSTNVGCSEHDTERQGRARRSKPMRRGRRPARRRFSSGIFCRPMAVFPHLAGFGLILCSHYGGRVCLLNVLSVLVRPLSFFSLLRRTRNFASGQFGPSSSSAGGASQIFSPHCSAT